VFSGVPLHHCFEEDLESIVSWISSFTTSRIPKAFACLHKAYFHEFQGINHFFYEGEQNVREAFFEASEYLARPNRGSVTECVNQLLDDNNENPIVRY